MGVADLYALTAFKLNHDAQMPRVTRPTKARAKSESSEESTDVEATPKPKKSAPPNARLKRRVSQFQPNDEDSEQRIPLKAFNDELAEKRTLKRRKSSRMTMAFEPLDDSQDAPEGQNDASQSQEGVTAPRKTALARANPLKSVVAPGPMVPVPLEIMTSNFEEWMKMATDNKINANNSWSFALIDYFHDMSLLRNDSDNSINFQKASRTLDGCVKIWTSRVDSVGTDTGKLLSNLAAEGRAGAGEDEENEEGGEGGEAAKKRKVNRQEATLAKSAAQLQTKKLDLEFTIDPLFKKTSGDFDEGGAQGLLMNHLAVDSSLRVIFDAMDTPGGAEEVEDEEVISLQVSLADLRAKLDYPSLSHRTLLSDRLSDFKFSANVAAEQAMRRKSINKDEDLDSEDEAAFQEPAQPYAEEMDVVNPDDAGDAPEAQDFFAGDEGGDGEDFGTFGMDVQGPDDDDIGTEGAEEMEGNQRPGSGVPGVVPFDPRRAPDHRELVLAMTEEGGASMMDYFDSNIIKNWAGPEHWKLRKVIRKPEKSDQPAAPKQRKEKVPFSIDFSKRLPSDIEKKLFEPPAKGSLTLPAKQCAFTLGKKKKGAQEKREEKLLPDDMHFSSRQLLSLFLKPKFMVNVRGGRARLRPEHNDEIDENFWARAAAEADMPPDEGDQGDDGTGMPFATQFFNDDEDDGGGGFEDNFGGDGGDAAGLDEDAELQAATQGQIRRVRPEFVNYAKKVKRVDVRKLKENIWKGLDIVLPKTEEEDDEVELSPSKKPTDPNEAKSFTSVISGLRKTYPKEKMEEISTSFCFICLLHLANERGLKIEGEDDGGLGAKMSNLRLSNSSARRMMEEDDPDYEDPEIVEARVGDIWGLRIYRDPDAIPSA